jgi:signal transduction histidine kinase
MPGGLFESGRRLVGTHPLAIDALIAASLLFLSTVWLLGSPFWGVRAAILQCALILPLTARRLLPSWVFVFVSVVAFVQWLFGDQLIGDLALVVALYTVAAHESRVRSLIAGSVLEAGAVMAAVKWVPAGTMTRSLLFLSATVVAAVCAGRTVASGSRYMDWLDEKAKRLEVERDQQAAIAAAAERTRIARELHDIVSHSLSVVITLADAAVLVTRSDPDRGCQSMFEVSEVGRRALSDMRAMLGVLRTEGARADMAPQPNLGELDKLIERVRATGLAVSASVSGSPFPLGDAVELTAYRIIQEALTNTIRHSGARSAWVAIDYSFPAARIRISDDGNGLHEGSGAGHGIEGMRERAALHGGLLDAGPTDKGGWTVSTVLNSQFESVLPAAS